MILHVTYEPYRVLNMVDKNWRQVKEIFDAALELDPADRLAYVRRACGRNNKLLSEVESLLWSYAEADSFLEAPAVAKVADVIEPESKKLEQGRLFGHYEIIRQIGEGGMGEVYLARDRKLDRNVAVKILNERFGKQESNLQRFIREAKTASALSHPNILVVHDVGTSEDANYIVSEFIDGETLRERLRESRLSFGEVLDIAIQTANALAAAHEANLVHRDIKPENIMIRPDGFVKVLDFGLAKLVEQKNKSFLGLENSTVEQNQTAKGVIMGTVNYMSPEQAKGDRVDQSTDIFSLGVVIYEMVAGRTPFGGDSVSETFANLIKIEPKPLALFAANVPDELQRIISKMLRKSTDVRYQTMKDVLMDLKELRENLSVEEKLARLSRSESENATAVFKGTTGDANRQTRETPKTLAHTIKRYRSFATLAALGLLLLGGIGLGGYFWQQRTVPNEIRSVAVMPFVNETGDPQFEYLSDGMTDTLISSLSELPNLKVKARTSVFRYKGKEIDPKAIGRELGVQAIINGRMAQRDGRTSVSIEVIDTETEDVIFSTKYDKPQSGLVTLQRDIARDVSGKLKSKLSGVEEAKVTKSHTADPEALQLYLQGQFYRYKGGRNNLLRAADYFSKAIERDPNYALAYAGLALNYSSYDFYNLVPDWQKASAAAKRALELDDSLAEAHLAAGNFRRAIELNPDYADAHVALCINLTMTKRFDEGISECRKAQGLDPSSAVVTTHLGAAYFFARRPDEAIAIFARAHDLDPTLWVPLGYLGGAQTLKGQYTEAAATFRKAIEISDGSPNTRSHLAYALAKAGQRDEALKLIDELKRQATHEHIVSFHFAVPYIGLGDKDEAFFWLGKGVDERSIGYAVLDVHPWFDELRSDPRFEALLLRTKLPES